MKQSRLVRVAPLITALMLATGLANAQQTAAPPAPADKPAEAEQKKAEPTEEAKLEAKQRFGRGIELYQDGDYALALIEFERVYELVPDYRVLYNIGQVSIQLGRYARATRALERYLAEGGEQIAAERKQAVEADLNMLKTRTAYLSIKTNVAGAEVILDDRVVGEAPITEPILVDAGEHRLQVRKPGFNSRPTQVALAGGESANVEITLTPDRTSGDRTVIVERQAAPVAVAKDDHNTLMWVGWTTTGVLAAGTAVVSVFAANSASDFKEDDKHIWESDQERDDAFKKVRTLETAAGVLGAATLVAGGVSLYLTLSGPSDPPKDRAPQNAPSPKPQVKAAVLPGGVSVFGTF